MENATGFKEYVFATGVTKLEEIDRRYEIEGEGEWAWSQWAQMQAFHMGDPNMPRYDEDGHHIPEMWDKYPDVSMARDCYHGWASEGAYPGR